MGSTRDSFPDPTRARISQRTPAPTRLPLQRISIFVAVISHPPQPSFATHLLEDGDEIRTSQALRGQKDGKTTMVYTHGLTRGPAGVRSPMDGL